MFDGLKRFIRRHPAIARLVGPIYARVRATRFRGSGDYWERRYKSGATSGAGSYGRLAKFKAEVLNELVSSQKVKSVIELGCGDGAQLSLMNYPRYVGIDVSARAVGDCRRLFENRPHYRFFHSDDRQLFDATYDLALSLDVLYHLVEEDVFLGYLDHLFALSHRLVVIYSSNFEQTTAFAHVRHRKFSDHVELRHPEWKLVKTVPNPYPFDPSNPDDTSPADFYIFERA